MISRFGQDNVELIEDDVESGILDNRKFDAIIAADVLEHFRELHSFANGYVGGSVDRAFERGQSIFRL